MTEQGQLLDYLFESAQFQILLKEQVTQIINTNNEAKRICSAAVPIMVTQIGNHLESIIDFRVKNSFNEEYSKHFQQSCDLRREIEEMRNELKKLNCGFSQEKRVSISRFSTETELPLQKIKQKEKYSSDSLQITKIQKQIQNLKQSIQKISHTSILQFVSQTNLSLQKKIDEKCSRLQSDIHEISQRNSDTSFQKTTSDFLDLKYQTLDQKLQSIRKNQQSEFDKFSSLETGLMDKMETNFAGVWNVIGQIQKNSNQRASAEKHKEPQFENLRSFISPTAKNSKKLSNIFNWN